MIKAKDLIDAIEVKMERNKETKTMKDCASFDLYHMGADDEASFINGLEDFSDYAVEYEGKGVFVFYEKLYDFSGFCLRLYPHHKGVDWSVCTFNYVLFRNDLHLVNALINALSNLEEYWDE